jgi:adenine-specific DNA-methyltransferase
MKYMGSKRSMLQNGLGSLLNHEVPKASRFVDLFTGSGAVAWHVATKHNIRVCAFDLQNYGVTLAEAVIARTRVLDSTSIWASWENAARKLLAVKKLPQYSSITRKSVREMRKWCANQDWPVTKAYGGHYFSAEQAIWIDAFRLSLPINTTERVVSLAALIQAASKCAAAPGHTAQPFQPTRTAKRYLKEAWTKDLRLRTKSSLVSLAALRAQKIGSAKVKDANEVAKALHVGDLVFVDPPYSGVQYSRFYHVLETIARGESTEVSGIGRYPPPCLRPRSKYSVITESVYALDDLLAVLASHRTRVILTFPNHSCSNGLSGRKVLEIAKNYFSVQETLIRSRFSTLGGNRTNESAEGRAPRHNADELILLLQ